MSKRKHEDDILYDVLNKKKRMEVSDEAREKSLLAFQDGLKEAGPQNKKRKRRKHRKQMIGFSSTIAAACIVTVLAFSTGVFDEHNTEVIISQGNGGNQGQKSEQVVTDEQNEETSNIKEMIWKRHPSDYNDLVNLDIRSIFNDDLMVFLPKNWTIDETKGENTYSIHMSGTDGERMNLVLFQGDNNQDVFNAHIQEMTASFSDAEQITIPADAFVDEIKASREIYLNYDNVFPFEIENAEITAFIDETSGKFTELYTSELFGYPMIFTSELSLRDTESWSLPLQFFASMYTHEPFVFQGSEGEPHPELNRPVEKTVLLPIGASSAEIVEMELFEIEELNMTSYLPRDGEVERIEHEHFTEWRFTETHIPESSFYSFGKLKSGFPLEDMKEIMFEAFDIDPAFSPPVDGDITHHYSYDTANAEGGIGIGGYFELFEVNGEWYYGHKHADWQDYNGGFLSSRLNYFIDSLEWH